MINNEKTVTLEVTKPDVPDRELRAYYMFLKALDNTHLYEQKSNAIAKSINTKLTLEKLSEVSLLLRYHHEKYPSDYIAFDEYNEPEWLIKKCLEEPIHVWGKRDGFLFTYQPITHGGCRVLLNYRMFIEGLNNLEGGLRSSF